MRLLCTRYPIICDGSTLAAAGAGLVVLGALDWLDVVTSAINSADCVRFGGVETLFSQWPGTDIVVPVASFVQVYRHIGIRTTRSMCVCVCVCVCVCMSVCGYAYMRARTHTHP